MPSRTLSSAKISRLGRGKLESGPARDNKTSWLDRRLMLVGVPAEGET